MTLHGGANIALAPCAKEKHNVQHASKSAERRKQVFPTVHVFLSVYYLCAAPLMVEILPG